MFQFTIPVHLRFKSSSHQHTTVFCSLRLGYRVHQDLRPRSKTSSRSSRSWCLLCHNEAISHCSQATTTGFYHLITLKKPLSSNTDYFSLNKQFVKDEDYVEKSIKNDTTVMSTK